MLSQNLLDRLRRRAADPESRTDAPSSAPETRFVVGAFKTGRVERGRPPAPPAHPAALAPPASAAALAKAEAALGVSLPDDLKQLYGEVANGGFGPSGGLAPLDEVTQRYRDLMANPPGEDGQKWPAQLLPINLTAPGADCYDLQSGEIILWDEESLAEGPSDRVWQGSFKKDAKSLEAWLEGWLAKPPLRETLHQDMEKALLDGLRLSLDYWRAMSPEERAEMGLPEEGWEEELFGHLGVDLKSL